MNSLAFTFIAEALREGVVSFTLALGVSYCTNGTYLWCVSPIKVGLDSFFGGESDRKA